MNKIKNVLPEFLTINYEKEYPGVREEYRLANMEKIEQIAIFFFLSLGFELEQSDKFEVKGYKYFKGEKIKVHFVYYEFEYDIRKRLKVTRDGRRSNRAMVKNIAQTISNKDYKVIEDSIDVFLKKDARKEKPMSHETLIVHSLMDTCIKKPYAAIIGSDGKAQWLKENSKEVIDTMDVNHYVIDRSYVGKKLMLSNFIKKKALNRYLTITNEDFC